MSEITIISILFALLTYCNGRPNDLPHSRDFYAGYIKALNDNFDQLFKPVRQTRSTEKLEEKVSDSIAKAINVPTDLRKRKSEILDEFIDRDPKSTKSDKKLQKRDSENFDDDSDESDGGFNGVNKKSSNKNSTNSKIITEKLKERTHIDAGVLKDETKKKTDQRSKYSNRTSEKLQSTYGKRNEYIKEDFDENKNWEDGKSGKQVKAGLVNKSTTKTKHSRQVLAKKEIENMLTNTDKRKSAHEQETIAHARDQDGREKTMSDSEHALALKINGTKIPRQSSDIFGVSDKPASRSKHPLPEKKVMEKSKKRSDYGKNIAISKAILQDESEEDTRLLNAPEPIYSNHIPGIEENSVEDAGIQDSLGDRGQPNDNGYSGGYPGALTYFSKPPEADYESLRRHFILERANKVGIPFQPGIINEFTDSHDISNAAPSNEENEFIANLSEYHDSTGMNDFSHRYRENDIMNGIAPQESENFMNRIPYDDQYVSRENLQSYVPENDAAVPGNTRSKVIKHWGEYDRNHGEPVLPLLPYINKLIENYARFYQLDGDSSHTLARNYDFFHPGVTRSSVLRSKYRHPETVLQPIIVLMPYMQSHI